MILINYSTLLEFTLADSITLETHAASSIRFETEHNNGTHKLATHTTAQSSYGNYRDDVDKSNQPSDMKIAEAVDQRVEPQSISDIHFATKQSQTNEYQSNERSYGTRRDSMVRAEVQRASPVANASIATLSQSASIANKTTTNNNNNTGNDEREDSIMNNSASISASIGVRKIASSYTSIENIHQADEPQPLPSVSEKFPERSKQPANAIYFVVAVMGGAKIWSRTLSRTLSDMGTSFDKNSLGTPLKPIYVDLPANGR